MDTGSIPPKHSLFVVLAGIQVCDLPGGEQVIEEYKKPAMEWSISTGNMRTRTADCHLSSAIWLSVKRNMTPSSFSPALPAMSTYGYGMLWASTTTDVLAGHLLYMY